MTDTPAEEHLRNEANLGRSFRRWRRSKAEQRELCSYQQDGADLQRAVAQQERDSEDDYPPDYVRRSIVHGRQDIVLMVSSLSALVEQSVILNRNVRAIRRSAGYILLLAIAGALYAACRHFGIIWP